MDMAGLLLCPDVLLGNPELSRIPSLSCGPLNIGQDDENEDIVLHDDSISLRITCLDLELFDGID